MTLLNESIYYMVVIIHECVTHTSSAFVRACARTCAKGPRVCVRVVRKEAELLAVDECVHPQGDLAPETRSGPESNAAAMYSLLA